MGKGSLIARIIMPAALVVTLVPAWSQVVINEFSYDDWRTDQPDLEEFVELYNSGDADVDLAGWTLATGGAAGAGPIFELPPGAVITAHGFYVLGSSSIPNVDHVIGEEDLLGNGPDYLLLRSPDQTVVDAVSYEANKGAAGFPPEATAEGGIWGNHVLVLTSYMSWQRWADGRETDVNGADFGHLPWTPGTSNDRLRPPGFSSDFEDFAPETDLEAFPGSFVPGRVVDPTIVSASNPNVIPESPDGGRAMVAWDPAGGGNYVLLEAAPAAEFVFEAWVYFDATLQAADEIESWSIGLAGTSGPFYNLPVVYDQNGNTGVTWTYQVTAAAATLYLVDEGFGDPAAARPHLAEIPITAGVNDGWQRLRLEVTGDAVMGYFGGTYGSTGDGQAVSGTLRAEAFGNFYIGYREGVADNAGARPPTLDRLIVGIPGTQPLRFKRGDANADGGVNIADAIYTLQNLFAQGPPILCPDAADANDDEGVNIADAIYVLQNLFADGPAIPPPHPGCGNDPTPHPMPPNPDLPECIYDQELCNG